jgi:hypothetical protein
MRALAPLSILWATLAACGGAQTGHGDGTSRRAEHFFPLSEGSVDVVGTVLAISRVDSRSGRRANVLDSAGIVVPYEVRDDGIFRPDKGVYLLREPLAVGASWASTAGMTATVTAMDRVVDTPAGRFTGCVEVVQAGGETGLRITTDYCPEVGPAKIVASMEMESGRAATTTGVLRGWVVR